MGTCPRSVATIVPATKQAWLSLSSGSSFSRSGFRVSQMYDTNSSMNPVGLPAASRASSASCARMSGTTKMRGLPSPAMSNRPWHASIPPVLSPLSARLRGTRGQYFWNVAWHSGSWSQTALTGTGSRPSLISFNAHSASSSARVWVL